MKIILDIVVNTAEDYEEARQYAEAVQRTAERKQWQGFEGCTFEFADQVVCVKSIKIDGAI